MMNKEKANLKSYIYQMMVTVAGMCLWLIAVASVFITISGRRPDDILRARAGDNIIGMFTHRFRVPLGLKFTQESIVFTLTDAFVLFVACWLGFVPAVFLAGIDGFATSRRSVRRLSSNLFSSAMMSLGAAAASASLIMVLRYGSGEGIRRWLQSRFAHSRRRASCCRHHSDRGQHRSYSPRCLLCATATI